MDKIGLAILIVGTSGIIIGLLLGIASKYLVVKERSEVTIIYELLPHFNCGACGYPGCQGMAEGLVDSEAIVTQCKPSKPEQRDAIIAKLHELGIEIKN